MPLLTKVRVLAAKIEATVGTAETLAAADAAMNVFDPAMTREIDFDEREGQGGFSPLPGTLGPSGGSVTFKTEVYGGATVPTWAATLLPACGFVDTADVFSPVSAPPGSGGVKTVTIGLYINGLFKKLRGCAGNVVFTFTSGRVVTAEWTFTGLWDAPADVAILAPTYPTVAPLRFVSAGLLLGGVYAPILQELKIDLGNNVILREDANDPTGYISGLITGRRITGSMNPEATTVATKNWWGEHLARTEQALAIVLGSAGNGVNFAAPKLQWTGGNGGDRDGLATEELEFQLNRSTAAGNDELAITII